MLDPFIILLIGLAAALLVWDKLDKTVRDNECRICGHRGHRAESCFHRHRICTICLEPGHIASVCTRMFTDPGSSHYWSFSPSLWILTWAHYLVTRNKPTRYCRACGERAHGTCQYAVRKCFRCRVKGHKSSACPGNWLYRKIATGVKYAFVGFIVVVVVAMVEVK